jgi:hypothetical protein
VVCRQITIAIGGDFVAQCDAFATLLHWLRAERHNPRAPSRYAGLAQGFSQRSRAENRFPLAELATPVSYEVMEARNLAGLF